MAAPLRNVSVNHNLILRRARIAGITSPQQPEAVVPSLVPESSNGRSKSPQESSNVSFFSLLPSDVSSCSCRVRRGFLPRVIVIMARPSPLLSEVATRQAFTPQSRTTVRSGDGLKTTGMN